MWYNSDASQAKDGEKMSDDCKCEFANSGELRDMIEKVAEKAAKDAAENVSNKLHLEMMEMERRMEKNLLNQFDSKLKEYFGMTPQEHAIEHDRMKKLYTAWEGISNALWKKIAMAIIVIALGATGVNIANSEPAIINKVGSQEQRGDDANHKQLF